ncbi:hypothetical protein AF332_03140 [Sporosarcina globispora]|uniref:Right handed beta helix domain-containing protein n=1 Tax=Sporosarcina globispora TaxID=1459 RepID=A0A0M0G7Z1_SPOGL|nr:right-handed parallel beta-helix repeat-containing protein [Sporosarcina globispora]KON85903.1 hypothetical protein AF332_03140 [Sporosarcina globispora]
MAVINVPAGGSINSAFTSANPGDTIRVAAGMFDENVVIPTGLDRLRLLGAGIGQTILDGTGSGGSGIELNSALVTIAGFTVRDYVNNGIVINTSDNIMRDLNVENNGVVGISIASGATHNLIYKIKSKQNGSDGIEINGNNNYVIESKFLENERLGMVLNGSNNLALRNTAIRNLGVGIEVGISVSGPHFLINNVSKRNGGDGIRFSNGGNFIYENKANRNDEDGFVISEIANNLIFNNSAKNNNLDGIDLFEADNNRVIGNKVKKNAFTGIELGDDSDQNIIDQNLVKKNTGPGILLTSDANDNAVRENTLRDNTPDIQADDPADDNNTFDENDCQSSSPPGLC